MVAWVQDRAPVPTGKARESWASPDTTLHTDDLPVPVFPMTSRVGRPGVSCMQGTLSTPGEAEVDMLAGLGGGLWLVLGFQYTW